MEHLWYIFLREKNGPKGTFSFWFGVFILRNHSRRVVAPPRFIHLSHLSSNLCMFFTVIVLVELRNLLWLMNIHFDSSSDMISFTWIGIKLMLVVVVF